MNNTTLVITHNIFLNREQRYSLQQKDAELEVVGVSVPIWYHKGKTSEPANEVFVKYKIKAKEEKAFVKHNKEGYEIILPCKKDNEKQDLSTENLLDLKDKGIMQIYFRQHTKASNNNKEFNVLHYVKIKDEFELNSSLIL